MSKVIKFGLSVSEIERAIQEVEKYKKELNVKCNALVRAMVKQGIDIAKVNVQNMGAFYTGELMSGIDGYFSPSTGVGIVYSGSWYSVYVEFGTGIRGKEGQHPQAGQQGWVYDSNNHGENGWVYFNDRDGKYHWTDGMPSRPFMYETGKELEAICAQIAKGVFK